MGGFNPSTLWQQIQGKDHGGDPRGTPSPRPLVNDAGIDFARPFVANAVGDVAGLGGTALGGPVGGIAANNLGYAATDALMQQLKSSHGTFGESFGEGEANALVNAVAGRVIGAVFRGANALRGAGVPEIYNYFPKSSQALEAHGYHTLASGASMLEHMAPNSNSAALDKSGGAGFTQALRFVNLLNGRQAGTNTNVGKLADQLKFALTDEIDPIESEYQPIKITKETAPYQPIKVESRKADYQPIDVDLKNKEFPSKGTQTRVIGAQKQVDIPGSTVTSAAGPIEQAPTGGLQTTPDGPIQTAKLAKYTVSQDVAQTLNNGKSTFQVLDDAIAPNNVDKLSKILLAGQANGQVGLNVKQDLQAYQFMQMLQKGAKYDSTGNLTRFDVNNIKNTWNDPDMQQTLDVLYGKQGKKDATDFLQNIFKTQATDPGAASTGQYIKNRSLWASTGGFVLGGGLLGALTGHLSGELAGLGGIAGLYLSANQLGRLLTKPETARVLVSMAGGEPLSAGNKLASKILLNSLQGGSLALMGNDGKKTWGSVVRGPDGSLTFQEPGSGAK